MNGDSTLWLTPERLSDVEEIIRQSEVVISLAPCPLHSGLRLPWQSDERPEMLEGRSVTYVRPRLDALFELMPEDFIATAPVSWTLDELDAHLRPAGFTVPHSRMATKILEADERLQVACDNAFNHSNIQGLIGFNPPHWLEGQKGTWRDWVLGMTAVTSEGKVVKSGSRVTKSVAGFDIHKFVIGSRSAFIIPLTVTLRIVPLTSLELPRLIWGDEPMNPDANQLVHRVMPASFESVLQATGGRFRFADPVTATFHHSVDTAKHLVRSSDDWTMGTGELSDFPHLSTFEEAAVRRAKSLLDPRGKLNPGILGIV